MTTEAEVEWRSNDYSGRGRLGTRALVRYRNALGRWEYLVDEHGQPVDLVEEVDLYTSRDPVGEVNRRIDRALRAVTGVWAEGDTVETITILDPVGADVRVYSHKPPNPSSYNWWDTDADEGFLKSATKDTMESFTRHLNVEINKAMGIPEEKLRGRGRRKKG